MTIGSLVAIASRVVRRVEVDGPSMLPTLAPGDRVLVIASRRVRVGDVVVAKDPEVPSRLVIKRVVAIGADGLDVAGDNPGASRDSRAFGSLTSDAIVGRAVYRYFPVDQRGSIRTRRRRRRS